MANRCRGSYPGVRAARDEASQPTAASPANPANNHWAAGASGSARRFTTTPATPAPKAAHISCTVLIAAAATACSPGSSTEAPPAEAPPTEPMAQTLKCGHAAPIPAPLTARARAQAAMAIGPAPSRMASTDKPNPAAITAGAHRTTRATIRRSAMDEI